MGKTTELAQAQRRALAELKKLSSLRGFYLAGGSAVAFHLHHRRSNDLDLFSARGNVDLESVANQLGTLPGSVIVTQTDAAVKVRLGRVLVDIVRYPYPPLRKPSAGPAGFPVAQLADLAAMKLSAIATRGIRRDFWDLHEILTRSSLTLGAALDAYVARFGVKKADLYHVLRSLTYFDDADHGPMPRGLTQAHWHAIKDYFLVQAPRALRKRI
jgi:hypothetical protein